MTWDHPRGYGPLDALTRTGELAVQWDRQPLEGFESTPIAELAETYDLMVIDHPGLGAALDALVPLDELFTQAELDGFRAATVGRSYDSYHLDGRQWALPIDAAAQVSAGRPGLDLPSTWDEVMAFAGSIALCLGGPHAFLMFCALTRAGSLDREQAYDLMAALLARSDREVSLRNPIGVLEAISGDRADYCPLLYGYATYPLAYAEAPDLTSVLGGTGVAVSRSRAQNRDAVREHLRRLLSAPVQTGVFAELGQPAARAAWESGGDFYRNTIKTVEAAWVRPRFDGYIALQERSSALIREGLLAGTPAAAVLDRLDKEWSERCPRPS